MIKINITDVEFKFCKYLAEIRTTLQNDGGDPSIGYTTYANKREENNLMGQVSEFAVLKFLSENKIAFSGTSFIITYFSNGNGVLPPLSDFVLFNGETIDIKSDRYNIGKLGAVVPTEKLSDIHIADYTFWLEYDENNDNQSVKIHGWNNKKELIDLLEDSDATRPDGSKMPKSCKRMSADSFRRIESFMGHVASLKSDGKYQIKAERVSHTFSK